MQNKDDMKEKEKKICSVAKAFLENPSLSIAEIAEMTSMSTSSVQRYLNDPIIIKMFNEQIFYRISKMLEQKKFEGRKKGGINSFKNNEPIKDEQGHFIGTKKTEKTNRLEQKCLDILVFSNMYLENPKLNLQQIADLYNSTHLEDERVITKDYVYDCLSDKKSYSLLSDNLYDIIQEQLSQRFNNSNKKK